ncbi:hypothetical protein ACT2GS_11925 [Paraburkholderia fungorum]
MLDYKGRWARRAFGGWFGACSAVFVVWLFGVLWRFGVFLLGSWCVLFLVFWSFGLLVFWPFLELLVVY